MKIKEILKEFEDNGDDDGGEEQSPYAIRMKDELVNYLSSLNATGAQTPIPTVKMVGFLKRMGYDVTEMQIADMLDDTAFGADPEKIDIKGQEPRDAMNGYDPEFNKKKVKSMSKRMLKKDINGKNNGLSKTL